MESFRKLGIIKPILQAIEDAKFDKPTDIQEKAIPVILNGKDVIAGAATGSGKTLAFGTSIIQNCIKGLGIQALVLTPTRELAQQIALELKKFSKYKPLKIVVVYGGVSINPQIEALRKADIVVGTPGRILDHLERGTISFRKTTNLVLDEADRMLDMGFIDDVRKIISQCPKERQTLLFSATIPPGLASLAKRDMKNPIKVSVDSYVDPKKLQQTYYDVEDNLKFSLLVHLLTDKKPGLSMVFCNTQVNTDFVANNLKLNGISALAIHGGFSQAKRNKTMEKFHAKDFEVLVCTDVAARGLDIKGVTHVYNYDIPKEPKQYIHRIGRTARAGKEGKAINILASRDHDNFSRLLREYDLNIKKTKAPYVKRVKIKKMERGFRRSGPRRFGDRRPPRRQDRPGHRPRQGSSRGPPRSGHRSGPRRSGQSGQGRNQKRTY